MMPPSLERGYFKNSLQGAVTRVGSGMLALPLPMMCSSCEQRSSPFMTVKLTLSSLKAAALSNVLRLVSLSRYLTLHL